MERDMHESENSIIYIRRGQEHRPQISDNILDPSDFMYPAYARALRALSGILANADEFHHPPKKKRKERKAYSGEFRKNTELYEYSSNMIAFCGGRGQGKTSVMRSFADALRRDDFPEEASKSGIRLDGMGYVYTLPLIDPSVLEEKDSIMAIILSNLFWEAERQWNHPPHDSDYDADTRYHGNDNDSERFRSEAEKPGLIYQFKHCFEEMRELQQRSIGGTDSLDALYEMGDSLDLKSDFFQLLQDFFHLLRKDPKKSFLLIQLDDTDLQFKRAYDVLEETRKYLALPNVIIIMATDIDQLRFLVAQRYYRDLSIAVKHKEVDARDVRKMASKYLDKLIPSTHAIYLPTVLTSQNPGTVIIEPDGSHYPVEMLETMFYNRIYETTGMVFIRHRDYLHSIIPRTLRGLQHLFRLLDTMPTPDPMPILGEPDKPDISLDELVWKEYCEKRLKRVKRLRANLLQFEDYFFSDWCSSRLTKAYWDFLREIRQDAISSRAVEYAVTRLPDVLATNDADNMPSSVEYNVSYHIEAQNSTHLTFNSGVGGNSKDIVQSPLSSLSENPYLALNRIISDPEQLDASQDDYALGFALHTYFSIQFNKKALEIQMESLNNQLKVKPLEEPFFFDYRPIQNMIGSQVFNSEEIQKQGIGESERGKFCFRVSNADNIRATIKEIAHVRFECTLFGNPFVRAERAGKGTDTLHYYCDLLHFFYNALYLYQPNEKPPWPITINDQRTLLNMQDFALYVCCNWDAQDQIIKALQNPENVGNYQDKQRDKLTLKRGKSSSLPMFCTSYVSTFFSHILDYLYKKAAPKLPSAAIDNVHDFVAECLYSPVKSPFKTKKQKSDWEMDPFFYTGVIAMGDPPLEKIKNFIATDSGQTESGGNADES